MLQKYQSQWPRAQELAGTAGSIPAVDMGICLFWVLSSRDLCSADHSDR